VGASHGRRPRVERRTRAGPREQIRHTGTRIAIGLGRDRGLVEVRDVEAAADETHWRYVVPFLWLDDNLQEQFDTV
jgi:hypothetical protein